MTLGRTFEPGPIEAKWYAHWEGTGAFRPARPDAEPYTIVIPPPNVTGSLHLGHALDATLQDVLIRYHRLRGRDALWVVGADHAGIATQMVVERQLDAEGVSRAGLGREAFLERVWRWREESGGAIMRQLRRLGASCDWANERFTMDAGFSRAVTETFVRLHREGLIYRDKRLVNWDPKLLTAISDLEVEMRPVQGFLWHFRYPLEDGTGSIAIATTRPETILGDGAVAVHPDDPRYAALVGKRCRLPIVDRLIPIIADAAVEQDFGSGAVKVTAAHDFNDFAIRARHPDAGIPLINLMTPDARMNDACPEAYRGLDRFEARAKVVAEFDALGLLERVEPHAHNVPFGDRSGVVIEPYLTDQWYVDAAKLAEAPMAAVRGGNTRFVPTTWSKTFFQWMENIQPWCVSRQLWWGHRVPAWYGLDGAVFVAEDEAGAQAQAGAGVVLRRDDDVLDTWFSSALWPFGTLGWPGATPDLDRHYPNSVLVTGFDIIFFWVARMQMMGHHLMGEAPFKTVYCHGLVRDAKGQKMSKSKGNTVDPLGLIDKYGADALRFFMASMESQGRDIKLSEPRIEGYRNFATKLWNAARFAQANGIGGSDTLEPPPAAERVNLWIIAETQAAVTAVELALADLRFDVAAAAIYQFAWSRYCDWYIELIKPVLAEPGAAADETRAVAGWVLDQILVLLHPFMPFITEELWHALKPGRSDLILARWPVADARAVAPGAGLGIAFQIGVIEAARSARAELNVPAGARLPLHIVDAGAAERAWLAEAGPALARLARVSELIDGPSPPGGAAQLVVDGATLAIPLGGVIDLAAERARLTRAADAASKEAAALAGRLANPGFLAKAAPAAIEEAREKRTEREAEAARLAGALARLE